MSKSLSKANAAQVSNVLWERFSESSLDLDGVFFMVNNPRKRDTNKTLTQALAILLFGFELPKTVICLCKHPEPTMHIFTSKNTHEKFLFAMEEIQLPFKLAFHTFDPTSDNKDNELLAASTQAALEVIYENNRNLGYLPGDSDIYVDTYGAHIAHQLRLRSAADAAPILADVCSFVFDFKKENLDYFHQCQEIFDHTFDSFLQRAPSASSYGGLTADLIKQLNENPVLKNGTELSILYPNFTPYTPGLNEIFTPRPATTSIPTGTTNPVILAMKLFPMNYKMTMARSLLISCSPAIISSYDQLTQIYAVIINKIKPGMSGAQIHDEILSTLQSKNFTTEDESFGFLVGPYDSNAWSISSDNHNILGNNRLLNIYLSVKDQNGINFVLSDVIQIISGGNVTLTFNEDTIHSRAYNVSSDSAEAGADHIAAENFNEGDGDDEFTGPTAKITGGRGRRKKISLIDKQREQINKSLCDKLSSSISSSLSRGVITLSENDGDTIPAIENYRVPEKLSVYVDSNNYAVVLPINSRMVPFHASLIKSITTTKVKDDLYELRVVFDSPGITGTSRIAKKNPQFERYPEATFIQELNFRAKKSQNFENVSLQFKMLQESLSKETKRKNTKNPIVPTTVNLSAAKRINGISSLSQVTFRPALVSTKASKSTDKVELGENGIRCVSGAHVLNIPFDNLKGMIVLTANNKDTLAIVHFNFIKPVRINNRVVEDFQIYIETGEKDTELSQTNRMSDAQAMKAEEAELKHRRIINSKFLDFAKSCYSSSSAWSKRYSKPAPIMDVARADGECSFLGTIKNTYLWRTSKNGQVLLAVSETPFQFLWMREIYFVLFERMKDGMTITSNFDMQIVFKQLDKKTVRISAISSGFAEPIRETLSKYNIPYFYADTQFNYEVFSEEYNTVELLKSFEAEGGWSSLFAPEDEDSDAAESESAGFQMSEGYDDEGSESLGYGDEAAYDDESASADYEEDDGLDWSELERQAEQSDEIRETKKRRGRP